VKFSGTPGEADAGSESPLTSGERRVADAFGGEQLVVAGDDEAVEASAAGIDGVGSVVVGVARRIEIENASVLFREASIPVETESGSKAEIGAELEFVLHVGSRLPGAIVAVGVALEKFCGGEVVVGIDEALQELGEIGSGDDA